jgi:hypothetical protein
MFSGAAAAAKANGRFGSLGNTSLTAVTVTLRKLFSRKVLLKAGYHGWFPSLTTQRYQAVVS